MDQRLNHVANIGDVDDNTVDHRLIDVASTEDDVDAIIVGDVDAANTMDQRLNDVANTGDVDAFYALLREDQYILEGIDLAPFVDTPLHIAIVAEKTNLAVEIANLKPSFARKLNQAGLSPIHLASTYGNLKIVRKLLSKDHDLCLLEGRGNRIPLHFAAEAGKVDVMKALLKDCPDSSIGMLTVCEETPLHLAAKNGQVEACKVLLKSIKKLNRWELMNWKDEDGKTALDVAAGSPEVLKFLKNKNPTPKRRAFWSKLMLKGKAMTETLIARDTRNAMLVVLAVIIAASFQAVVSPPGGVWQDTIYSNSSNANTTTARSQPAAHYAGKAVMGQMYIRFANINTLGFCVSIVAIILLTMDIPFILQFLLMCCTGPMMIIYLTAIKIINPIPEGNSVSLNLLNSDLAFSVFASMATFLLFGCIIMIRLIRLSAMNAE